MNEDDPKLGIDFEVEELRPALDAFDELIERAERLYDRWSRLGTVRPGSGGVASGGNSTTGGTGAGSQQPPQAQGGSRGLGSNFVQGPYQRLEKLQQQLGLAHAQGNENAEKDIQLSIERANKQIARNQPKSFMSTLGTAIRSTRFGSGIEPLVGRSLDVVTSGLSALGVDLAPETMGVSLALALVAGASVKAAEEIVKMADAAAQAVIGLQAAETVTGATPREALSLRSMGAVLGRSPEDMAGISTAFQRAITTDPFARAAAARFGIQDLPVPFGKLDQASLLIQMVQAMQGMSDQEKTQFVRMVGPSAEAVLPLTMMSARQMNALNRDTSAQQAIAGGQFGQQSADFEGAIARVTTDFETLGMTVIEPLLPTLTALANTVADDITVLTRFGSKISDIIGLDIDILLGRVPDALNKLRDFFSNKDDFSSALKENTQATRDNTNAIAAPGTYGRSDRLASALGEGMDGTALNQLLSTQQIHQLNAF